MSTNESRQSTASLIAGILIVAAGLGLSGKSGYDIFQGASSGSWPAVKGTIESSEVKRIDRAGKSDRFETDIRYTYKVDGQAYSSRRIKFGERRGFRDDVEPVVAKYPPGSEVDVYYNPDAPGEAVLETVVSFSMFALLFGPLTVLFGLYILRSGFKQLRVSS